MHIKKFQHQELSIDKLKTSVKEIWCVFGLNNSGINEFAALFSGKNKTFSAEILELPEHPAVLSFETQQEIYEEEIRNDDTDFMGTIDPGTLVSEFIPDYRQHLPLLKAFGMDHCLHLGYRQLSSGQSRKVLLLQKLTSGATTLILQNPFDGLDQKSCQELELTLQQLPGAGIELMLLVNSVSDIPGCCTHLAVIESGYLKHSGEKETVLPLIFEYKKSQVVSAAPITRNHLSNTTYNQVQKDKIISLKDGYAAYGNKILFRGLDLIIYSGDHTLITGPNGCGKSTLLDIITGDNQHCYVNKLEIFGRKRGSGESIWDIKKHMGIVSPALHREHRVPGSALHVILSGLYDSIGLYRKVTTSEIKIAEQWLSWLSLKTKGSLPFRKLSYAEQRLILIGRALIKRPKLLILDEPSQGLDDLHRNKLLDLLEDIADRKLSTILFVSHRKDEQRSMFTKKFQLDSFAP